MNSKGKLEDSTLWQRSQGIAEQTYALAQDLPEHERWGMQSKLCQRAFEATVNVGEALGSIDPRDRKYYLGLARRDFFSIKNALYLAVRLGYLEHTLESISDIDKALAEVEVQLEIASGDIPNWFKEMQPPESKGRKL